MQPFNLALAIELIYMAAQYRGATNENTRQQYERMIWQDARPQPTWDELQAAWAAGWQTYYPENPEPEPELPPMGAR